MDKKKILYLEDDPTIALLTQDFLEQHYQVVHCEDGNEAIKLFNEHHFDLCVLDILLPTIDGFEVAKHIRAKNQNIPIIFLSAKTLKEDRIYGLKIGADDYLVKPFSLEELHLKIEVFVQRSQKNTIKASQYNIGKFLFDPSNFLLKSAEQAITLTEREALLLELFLNHPNQVLKREYILTKLWGNDDYFSGRSLDVFVSRLRKIFKEDPHVKFENIPRIGFKLVVN